MKKLLIRTVAACLVIGSAGMLLQRNRTSPVSAAETTVTIRRPEPLRYKPHETVGDATIPDSVSFGFVGELGGVLLTGDWKVIGTVTGVDSESGTIAFQTESFSVKGKLRDASQRGNFAYRLPQGLKIPLVAGDPITILHDHEIDEKRMEWDMHISSGETLILATTHMHDDSPPRSADTAELLFDGAPGGHLFFFWSDPKDNDTDQELKGTAETHSPVSLKIRDNGTLMHVKADGDRVTLVELNNQRYQFVVLSSEHFPHDHSEGDHSDHSHSHSIECMLVRADPLDRQ